MIKLSKMSMKEEIIQIGKQAKNASYDLALLSNKIKNEALILASENIKIKTKEIIEANEKDLIEAKKKKISPALLDRLLLNEERIQSICDGMVQITNLEDPVGKILSQWKRPNGLIIEKVSVPLGVIGVIYELSLIHI